MKTMCFDTWFFCVSFGTLCHKVHANGAASWTSGTVHKSCDCCHLSHKRHNAHVNILKQSNLQASGSICKHLQMLAKSISNKNLHVSQTKNETFNTTWPNHATKWSKEQSGSISTFSSGTNASFPCIVGTAMTDLSRQCKIENVFSIAIDFQTWLSHKQYMIE